MDTLAFAVRSARSDDAQSVARVYIESWHDTYPAILPAALLRAMTPKGQAMRWRAAIVGGGRERVLVAECAAHGIVGMTSFGPAQDRDLSFDGEVYTLYVAPGYHGAGIGSALLHSAFGALKNLGCSSGIIWAHAYNPARFFYEAMGGRLVAERSRSMRGTAVPEVAFGWRSLAIPERGRASGGTITRP